MRILLRLFCLFKLSQIQRLSRNAFLRMRGVNVSWTASIHKSAEIDPGGGIISIGDRTLVDKGVIIRAYGGNINFGDDCTVNPYSVIYGHGGLFVGNGVRIATHCVFIPANHIYADPNIYI